MLFFSQAIIITGLRYLCYSGGRFLAENFARQQIELAKPKWGNKDEIMCKDNETRNEKNNDKSDVTKRRGKNTVKNGMNGHTNESDKNEQTEISEQDLNRLLKTATDQNTTQHFLLRMCEGLSLSRIQINDVKRYRKR